MVEEMEGRFLLDGATFVPPAAPLDPPPMLTGLREAGLEPQVHPATSGGWGGGGGGSWGETPTDRPVVIYSSDLLPTR